MSVLSGEITLNNPLNEAAFKCCVLTSLSQAVNSFRFTFNCPADGVKPIVVKIDNRPAERFLACADPQLIAADFPNCREGTPPSRKIDIIFSASSAATEITMRDCDSLKRISVAVSLKLRSRSTPKKPDGLRQHSVSATASPPSEQSCALFTRPSRIKSRTTFCTLISSSRSTRGGGPCLRP